MNRRPTLLAAITLTAAAALTLSACGGDSDSEDKGNGKSNDKIAGADTGDAKSVSPTAGAADVAGRPEITLPSDLKLTFETTRTGDAVKDAVLADNAERMRAVDSAITGTDPDGKALAYYNTGKAREAALAWVQQFKDANASLTGEARYYDRNVTLKSETTALLSFCTDESKGFSKDKKTGKADKTPVTKNSYVRYDTRLELNSAGTWQTSQIISTRGAAQCRP